jgi:hypothetical protein
MDEGKWLIINLSKGQLRENSHLLGALLIAKLKLAAMTRAELPEKMRLPFYGFIDEFQHFISIGEDFETILSEARKYGLGLTMAHQNLDQMDLKLKASILSNVSTQIIFRLSHHDAMQISYEMDRKAQALLEKNLIDFKVGQAYLKLRGEKPRLMRTHYVTEFDVDPEVIQLIKDISFANFARPRITIEQEILNRRNMLSNQDTERSLLPRTMAIQNNLNEGWNDW